MLEIGWRDQERRAQISATLIIRNSSNVKYSVISVDPEISVLDVIARICNDNGWEWYLGHGGYSGESPAARSRINTIYIGKKIRVEERWALPFNIEDEHCQRIETSNYITLTTESIWCEPLLLFGKPIEGRVIWTKMYINNAGCLMTLMIQKAQDTAPGGTFTQLTEEDFIMTLDKGYGREYGLRKIWRNIRSFGVLIGKMFGEIDIDNSDKYEAPEWSGDIKEHSKNLNHRSFETSYGGKIKPYTYLKDLKITTPYAGDGVGVQYPQDNGYKTLLVPDGDRELAVLGPGYFGAKDEVPYRQGSKDYRLQLPDNTVVYNKNDDTFYINGKNKLRFNIGGLTPGQDPSQGSAQTVIDVEDGKITVRGSMTESIIVENGKIKISGSSIEIDAGIVKIQGVTILKGDIIKATMLITNGGVVPPNTI